MHRPLTREPIRPSFALRLAAPDAWVVAADPRHMDAVIAALIMAVERRGKRTLAQRIVYEAVRLLRKRFPCVPRDELVRRSLVSVRRTPRGGRVSSSRPATDRSLFPLARVLVIRARARTGGPMALRLAEGLAEGYRRSQPPPPPQKALGVARATPGG